MRKTGPKELTGYQGSHAVFLHAYSGASHSHAALFAVRRVHAPDRNETQIEARLEATKHRSSRDAKPMRTASQHMSLCMPPAEAIVFAAAIAPELADTLRLLLEHPESMAAQLAARTILAAIDKA